MQAALSPSTWWKWEQNRTAVVVRPTREAQPQTAAGSEGRTEAAAESGSGLPALAQRWKATVARGPNATKHRGSPRPL